MGSLQFSLIIITTTLSEHPPYPNYMPNKNVVTTHKGSHRAIGSTNRIGCSLDYMLVQKTPTAATCRGMRSN